MICLTLKEKVIIEKIMQGEAAMSTLKDIIDAPENKRPRSKLRGIGLPKNAASCGEWTRRDSKEPLQLKCLFLILRLKIFVIC
jgi:hypothetical protein